MSTLLESTKLAKTAVVAGPIMLGSMLLAGSAAATSISQPVWCDAPEPIKFTDIVYTGSGCPPRRPPAFPSVEFLGGEDEFSILYRLLIAEQGPDTQYPRNSNCNVRLKAVIPPGWQFNAIDVQYSGFADVPKDVIGYEQTRIQFPLLTTASSSLISKTNFTGPYVDRDEFDLNVWSKCGGEATIAFDSYVWLKGDRWKSASMTLDAIDGAVTKKVGITCRPCMK